MASRQPTPVPLDVGNPVRRNRDPLAPEMAHVREEIALNDGLLDILRQQLVLRTTRLEEAHRNTESKGTQSAQARLRLDTAEAFLAVLSRTEREITLSATRIRTTHQGRLESAVASASAHGQGVAETLDMWREYERDIERRIEEATVAVGFARAAVAESVEEKADALAREEQCLATVEGLGRWIADLNTINGMRRSRAIWRVPDEVWRHIFLEVISSSDIRTGPVQYPSLTLSWVSRGWRAQAERDRSLWAKIDIDTHAFSDGDVARVRHYLVRRGTQPLTLRIRVHSTDAEAPLLTDVLAGVGPVRHLLFNGVQPSWERRQHGESAGLIERLTAVVTPPAEISFLFQDHFFDHFILPDHALVNIKSLHLVNAFLYDDFSENTPVPPLTSLHFEMPTRINWPWGQFYRFFRRALTTVENLVILSDFEDTLCRLPVERSRFMECLSSIKTDLRTISLMHKTRVYAPILRHLEITRPTPPIGTMDDWSRCANDPQLGASVDTISLLNSERVLWGGFYQYLQDFPGLTDLKLHGNGTELFRPFTAAGYRRIPFMKLERLYVYDYNGDGASILVFAQLYHGAMQLRPGNPDYAGPRPNMLSVQLWNCGEISRQCLQTLTEIGAFTAGGGVF